MTAVFEPSLFLRILPLLFTVGLVGCDGQSGPNGDLLNSNVKGSISGMFLVNGVEPSAVVAGDQLKIKGVGFSEGMKIVIGGVEVPVDRKVGDYELTITVPTGLPGLTSVTVSQDQDSSSHNFVRLSSDGVPVMAGADKTQMCAGQKVYTMTGELVEGERVCEGFVPVCSTEGQKDCVASEKFPSVSISGLEERVIAGKWVAGVEGKAKIHEQCSKDGETDCVTIDGFRAADVSRFTPEQIPVGLQIAGVQGKLSAHPVCAGDGEQNCLVTGTFASVDTSGLALKVLAGQTVAGVPGSYAPDFPEAQHVLNNDTVNGTPGTLTLPLATNVKSGTPSYGVNGSGSVPSYNPDFPDVGNVLNTDTVNSVVGTLTLPPAGDVKSGTPSYGVNGSGSVPSYTPDFPDVGNVLNTDTVNSVVGTLTLPPAGDVKSGTPSYGVNGSGSVPSYTPDFPERKNVLSSDNVDGQAGTLTLPNPANVLSGSGNYGVSGSESEPSLTLPTVDKVLFGTSYGPGGTSQSGTVPVYSAWNLATSFPGAGYYPGVSNLPLSSDIRSTVTVLGVGGNVIPTPGACAVDGQTGCVANASFKAASMAAAVANSIKSGVTIAGVAGNYGGGASSQCLVDGASSCLVNGTEFVAASVVNAAPANIRQGVRLAGVDGTYAGGTAVTIQEPAGNDDVATPGGNFTLQYQAIKAAGDTDSGVITIYRRSDGITSGCAGDPAQNGWAVIADNIGETSTSYQWASVPWGVHNFCIRFYTNPAFPVFSTSRGNLKARDSVIFATSSTYKGNFMSLEAADGHCISSATSANLALPTSYKALLSTDAIHAKDRLEIGAVVYNTNDQVVAIFSDFWTKNHLSPILLPNGLPTATFVWTGTTSFGHSTGSNCSNWTVNNTSAPGAVGSPSDVVRWSAYGMNQDCGDSFRLYCVGHKSP